MTAGVFGGTIHNQVFVSLALIATVVSSVSSSTVLILIKRMNVWNQHLSLLFAMASFELMYDVFFFSCMVDTKSFPLTVLSNIAVCLGGTTSSMLSNVIALVALYVVYYRKTIDLMPYYYLIIAVASIPGMIVIIMYIMVLEDAKYSYLVDVGLEGIYYYTRLATIGINVICCVCTAVIVRRMKSLTNARSDAEIAINRLSMRMFYYPIVQAIGRSGCAWYEMEYGYNYQLNRTVNLDPPDTTDSQFAVQCWMTICIPLIAVGYLVIFLIMQPDASKRVTAFVKDWKLFQGTSMRGDSNASGTGSSKTTMEITSRLSEASAKSGHTAQNPMYGANDGEGEEEDDEERRGSEHGAQSDYSSRHSDGGYQDSIPASRFNSNESENAAKIINAKLFDCKY